jgi:hypothetical protein
MADGRSQRSVRSGRGGRVATGNVARTPPQAASPRNSPRQEDTSVAQAGAGPADLAADGQAGPGAGETARTLSLEGTSGDAGLTTSVDGRVTDMGNPSLVEVYTRMEEELSVHGAKLETAVDAKLEQLEGQLTGRFDQLAQQLSSQFAAQLNVTVGALLSGLKQQNETRSVKAESADDELIAAAQARHLAANKEVQARQAELAASVVKAKNAEAEHALVSSMRGHSKQGSYAEHSECDSHDGDESSAASITNSMLVRGLLPAARGHAVQQVKPARSRAGKPQGAAANHSMKHGLVQPPAVTPVVNTGTAATGLTPGTRVIITNLKEVCASIYQHKLPPNGSATNPTWLAETLNEFSSGLSLDIKLQHAKTRQAERVPEAVRAATPDIWYADWFEGAMRFLINCVNPEPKGHDSNCPTPQAIKAELDRMLQTGKQMLVSGSTDQQLLIWLQASLVHLFQRRTGLQYTADLMTLHITAGTKINKALRHIERALAMSAVMHPDPPGSTANDQARKHALASIVENFYPELLMLLKPQLATAASSSVLMAELNHYREANFEARVYVPRPTAVLTTDGVVYVNNGTYSAETASSAATAVPAVGKPQFNNAGSASAKATAADKSKHSAKAAEVAAADQHWVDLFALEDAKLLEYVCFNCDGAGHRMGDCIKAYSAEITGKHGMNFANADDFKTYQQKWKLSKDRRKRTFTSSRGRRGRGGRN